MSTGQIRPSYRKKQQAETPTFPDCSCSSSFTLLLLLLFFLQESFFLCASLLLSPTSLEVRFCDFDSFCEGSFFTFFSSGFSARTLEQRRKGVRQCRCRPANYTNLKKQAKEKTKTKQNNHHKGFTCGMLK